MIKKVSSKSYTSTKIIEIMLKRFMLSVEEVLKNVEHSNTITQEQAEANQTIAQMLEGLKEIRGKLRDMADRKF